MGYRNLFISNPARLSVKNEQLVIDNGEKRTVPLEDIECIVFDNLRTDISTMAISKFAEYRITVFIPDEKHMPSAVILPFCSHSRHLSVIESQISLSKPQSKRLWAEIVRTKITNQALVLKLIKSDKADYLFSLAEKVKSGDSDNIEAVAAAVYFPSVFGDGFRRRDDDDNANAPLNYGYSIFRSTAAKLLCAYGFEPSLGLFHHSVLNKFNLADDIMEPFRPLVDLFAVYTANDIEDLTPKYKAALVNLLNTDMLIKGKKYAASYAMEKTVQSLSSCILHSGGELLLPQITELALHTYE